MHRVGRLREFLQTGRFLQANRECPDRNRTSARGFRKSLDQDVCCTATSALLVLPSPQARMIERGRTTPGTVARRSSCTLHAARLVPQQQQVWSAAPITEAAQRRRSSYAFRIGRSQRLVRGTVTLRGSVCLGLAQRGCSHRHPLFVKIPNANGGATTCAIFR
jgi:hypothetical protein